MLGAACAGAEACCLLISIACTLRHDIVQSRMNWFWSKLVGRNGHNFLSDKIYRILDSLVGTRSKYDDPAEPLGAAWKRSLCPHTVHPVTVDPTKD